MTAEMSVQFTLALANFVRVLELVDSLNLSLSDASRRGSSPLSDIEIVLSFFFFTYNKNFLMSAM